MERLDIAERRHLVAALYEAGEKIETIAEDVGVCRGTLRSDLRAAGVTRRASGRPRSRQTLAEMVLGDRARGLSVTAIARRLGVSWGTIRAVLDDAGIERRPAPDLSDPETLPRHGAVPTRVIGPGFFGRSPDVEAEEAWLAAWDRVPHGGA